MVDRGNVPAPLRESGGIGDERKKYVDDIAEVCRRVKAAAHEALDAGALPVMLGGDHSLAAGSVAASAAWVRQGSATRWASSGWTPTAT